VEVETTAGVPLLASWQDGLGRAVAWASDDGSSAAGSRPASGWAGSWSAMRLPTFWRNMVGWAVRGYLPDPRSAQLSTTPEGTLRAVLSLRTAGGLFDDRAQPRLRLGAPDGTVQEAAAVLTGPGQYTAQRPLQGAGIYTATVVGAGAPAGAPWDVAALAVPYPREYAPDQSGADTAFLAQVAAATGGRLRTSPTGVFARDRAPSVPVWQPLWPYLLALALLLFPLDVATRLLLPSVGRRP
jgi:hypothetical protein